MLVGARNRAVGHQPLQVGVGTGHGLHYEVLVDVDLAIAMASGVVFRTLPLHAALLRRRGVNLAGHSGSPAWLLPVPAAFLAGPDGVVRRSWGNVDFTQRAEPTEILTALTRLQTLRGS